MILDRILAAKRARAPRGPVDLDALQAEAARLGPPRPFASALRDVGRPAPRVIAEFKRASPSAGVIRAGADPAEIALAYQAAGAAALSVLTEASFFQAGPEDLGRARAAVSLPVLRKDFLLEEREVLEARLAGADAVLLIVRILEREQLASLLALAHAVGLEALVEAHDERELETALEAGARVVGVNHRDLDTLTIDLGLSQRARAVAGPEAVLVAESGLATPADVERMRGHEVDAILVGESLLRAPSPGAALRELLSWS